jgi:general secretion pathway protein E
VNRPISTSARKAPEPMSSAAAASSATSATMPSAPPKGRLEWPQLLDWLHADGLISAADAHRVAARFKAGNSSLHALVRLGGAGLTNQKTQKPNQPPKLLDTEALTEWLAGRCRLPYLRIDPLRVDVGRVAEVMSVQYAELRRALPVTVSQTEVVIATAEPFDVAWVSEIEAHTRRSVRLMVANPDDLRRYTTEFYALARNVRAAQKSGENASAASFEQLVELGKTNKALDANDQGVVQVVDWLWQYAFDQRASDIHLEPRRDMGAIRFRIDGVLHTVYQVPLTVMSAMTARIKLLGRMDVVEKRRPLDGRIKTRRPDSHEGIGGEVEMRLSTLPTAFGEKMVMRIFDPETTVKGLAALGFGNSTARAWQDLIARPHGIILVTGPTGSGKTTTLYSTLKSLANDEVNVCTIEDPIEMIEPAFNQTQVHTAIDMGFAEGLRALMRQDPDIIMVGEIRDLATAEMAIQAALTGHLVFSTLHTNDAVGAVTRLADLGVPSYLIAATLVGVLAQRLARTLCEACKVPDPEMNKETLDQVVKPWHLAAGLNAYKPVGCLECRHTGYRGRAGLYELLTISEGARAVIHPSLDGDALRSLAVKEGMRPLRLAGVRKVAEGVTTLEEVLRCTPDLSV